MQIRLTQPAAEDLEQIEAYVAQDNPLAAAATVVRVLEAVEALAAFPNIGRPGRVAGTRELVVGGTPFVAVYTVKTGTIWIVRVLHGAQRWPSGPH